MCLKESPEHGPTMCILQAPDYTNNALLNPAGTAAISAILVCCVVCWVERTCGHEGLKIHCASIRPPQWAKYWRLVLASWIWKRFSHVDTINITSTGCCQYLHRIWFHYLLGRKGNCPFFKNLLWLCGWFKSSASDVELLGGHLTSRSCNQRCTSRTFFSTTYTHRLNCFVLVAVVAALPFSLVGRVPSGDCFFFFSLRCQLSAALPHFVFVFLLLNLVRG